MQKTMKSDVLLENAEKRREALEKRRCMQNMMLALYV